MNITRGNRAFKAQNYRLALAEYEKIGKDNPLFAQANYNIALIKKHLEAPQTQNTLSEQNKQNSASPEVKVSVVVPTCNVQDYLHEAMQSLLKQTLKEIEIICVNDGSTDDSFSILEGYRSKFKNIQIVHKCNNGYGSAVNEGLKRATGEYVGIVEPDDYIASNMYEDLYNIANHHGVDIARGTAIAFSGNKPLDRLYGQPVDDCLEAAFTLKEVPDFMTSTSAIWSAIYRREFLEENHLRAPETAGASYQDVAFFFMTSFYAEQIYCTWRPYYFYRNDNPNASRFAKGKVNAIFDVYEWLDARLNFTDVKSQNAYLNRRLNDYKWNYNRVAEDYQHRFLANVRIQLDRLNLTEEAMIEIAPRFRDFLKTVYSQLPNSTANQIENKGNPQPPAQNPPFLSVVVPVFNAATYINEFMHNLAGQSFGDFEVIFVDDCSTDGTPKLIEQFSKTDHRVQLLIQQRNYGASPARNAGLKVARGKYVRFLDCDDKLPNNSFEVLCNLAMKHDSDVIKGSLWGYNLATNETFKNNWGGRRYYENVTVSSNMRLQDSTELWNLYDHQAFIIKRELLERHGIIYPTLKNCQDPPVVAEVLCKADSITVTSQCVYYLVCGRKTSTITRSRWDNANFEALLDGYRMQIEVLLNHGHFSIAKYKLNTFGKDWFEKIRGLTSIKDHESTTAILARIAELYTEWKYKQFSDNDPPEIRAFFHFLNNGFINEALEFLDAYNSGQLEPKRSQPVLFFFPIWDQKNPYLNCVYQNIDAKVQGGSLWRALGTLLSNFDERNITFHLHWTDLIAKCATNTADASKQLYIFFDILRMFKENGGRVIWTLHNTKPHENTYPEHEAVIVRLMTRYADLIVTHNISGREILLNATNVDPEKVVVWQHGNYIGCYPAECPNNVARIKLRVPQDYTHFLFIGLIRPYKGVTELIEEFQRQFDPSDKVYLTIAGQGVGVNTEETLRQMVANYANIRLDIRFIPDEDLQIYIKAADFIVLPYRKILTSGTALLALSFSRPVIVPNLGGLQELVTDEINGYIYSKNLGETLKRAQTTTIVKRQQMNQEALKAAIAADWSDMRNGINDFLHNKL